MQVCRNYFIRLYCLLDVKQIKEEKQDEDEYY
jgi:hypothetical protein